jgi:hypothetical protein
MSSDIYKILYCSKNLIEGEQAKRDTEISNILQAARSNNKRHNVTGALLFNGNCFAQALEGPKLAIEEIFEKIQRDTRHSDVTVLQSETRGERDFPEWSMAHVQTQSNTALTTLSSTLNIALLHPDTSGDEILELLKSLVLQED